MQIIKKTIFNTVNINFFYFVPILLFGSIYLINLSKNIFKIGFNQKKEKSLKN